MDKDPQGNTSVQYVKMSDAERTMLNGKRDFDGTVG